MTTRDLVRTALMIAMCVAIGHLLALVPNVELFSAAVCCCGFLTGIRRGALIGGAAALLYFGFNVNGVAPPPLLLAQVIAGTLIGMGGGLLRRSGAQRSWLALTALAGLAGFVLTFVYDVLTNTAGYLMVREGSGYWAWLVAGLTFPFPLAHALLNTVSFALAVPAVARRVRPAALVCALGVVLASDVAGAEPDLVLEPADWIVFQPLSVEELLERCAGVVVYKRGGLGSPEFLSIAGSTNGRIHVVVDGMESDEPELVWPRLFGIAVSDIERIALHRTTDPVRIEIWTRAAPEAAPTADFDLARGDLGARTRRMQFFTPEASVRFGVRYEELLRAEDDFRTVTSPPPPDLFGSYNGRNVAYVAEITRGSQTLRAVHEEFNDNAHGSYQSTADVNRALRARDRLVWTRPVAGARLRLDLSSLAWDRDRIVNGTAAQVSESRRHAGVELALPERNAWKGTMSVQARRIQGEVVGAERVQFGAYAGEVQLERRGNLAASAWLGAHRDERFGNAWSARARAGWTRGTWTLFVQGGRGVSFAGWGEPRAAGDDGQRIGQHASAGLRRNGKRATLELDAFFKDIEDPSRAADLYFPDLGAPPRQVAGALARAAWDDAPEHLQYGLDVRLGWVPHVRGERQGIPILETEVQTFVGRQDWFKGDLSMRIAAAFRAQTLREFDGFDLSSFATGDLVFNVLLLRRIQVFWNITNLIDERYSLHPGVLDPGRRSLIGLQARFFD